MVNIVELFDLVAHGSGSEHAAETNSAFKVAAGVAAVAAVIYLLGTKLYSWALCVGGVSLITLGLFTYNFSSLLSVLAFLGGIKSLFMASLLWFKEAK